MPEEKIEDAEKTETEEEAGSAAVENDEIINDENKEDSPDVEENQEEELHANGFQKRINKITADKRAALSRAQAAEERLRQLEQGNGSSYSKRGEGPPSLEDPDIDYDEDKFLQARVEYVVGQKLKERGDADIAKNFAKRVAAMKTPDYSEKINNLVSTVSLPIEVSQAIQRMEKGPQVAYYLAENLDIADEIAGLPPLSAAVELGKIEARLDVVKSKQTTRAPDPVKTIRANGKTTPSLDKMTIEELYAHEMSR